MILTRCEESSNCKFGSSDVCFSIDRANMDLCSTTALVFKHSWSEYSCLTQVRVYSYAGFKSPGCIPFVQTMLYHGTRALLNSVCPFSFYPVLMVKWWFNESISQLSTEKHNNKCQVWSYAELSRRFLSVSLTVMHTHMYKKENMMSDTNPNVLSYSQWCIPFVQKNNAVSRYTSHYWIFARPFSFYPVMVKWWSNINQSTVNGETQNNKMSSMELASWVVLRRFLFRIIMHTHIQEEHDERSTQS
jgi:hypothetical protein